MYRDSSSQSGDREITVYLDLIKVGLLTPSSETQYDLVVDMGDRFETVRVKNVW